MPTSAPAPLLDPIACPAGILEGELVADDEFGFVVAHADGFSSAATCPHGFVARDAPRRELLDDPAVWSRAKETWSRSEAARAVPAPASWSVASWRHAGPLIASPPDSKSALVGEHSLADHRPHA